MEFKNAEYIQDIAFNDTCDIMVLATTSKEIIIYNKVLKNSDCLIMNPSEKKPKETPLIKKGPKEPYIFELDNEIDPDSDLIPIDSNSNKKINKKKNKKNKEKNKNKNKDIKKRSKTPYNKRKTKFEEENDINMFNENKFNNELSDDFNFESSNKIELIYGDNPNNLLQKRKEFEYHWEQIAHFNMDGPVLRIQFANNEFGNIFACSGYNKWIYVFKGERNDKNIEWNQTLIKLFSDAVIDISFLPKIYSLRLASITLDGYLKILKPTESWKNWEQENIKISKISNTGCTCLCCNPSCLDELIIVIGCKKNNEEKNLNINDINNNINKKESSKKINKDINNVNVNINNEGLLKFVFFKENHNPKIISINDCYHKNDITDVDWANQNGRTYHMICSTSKDGKFIIWEINLLENEEEIGDNNFFTYKKIFEFNHDKPLWRCSFNDSGIIASCIGEDGKTFSFLKIAKNQFIKLDIEKTK